MTDPKPKSNGASSDQNVPSAVVSRLSLYLRELQRLLRDGQATISSSGLGRLLNFTDAQVRKDLAYFGHFGYPGVGYRCEELVAQIRKILGTDRGWAVALIGIGNLGRALLGYKGFLRQGFRFVAAFDNEPKVIGSEIDGIQVYSLDALPEVAKENRIRLAVLAVPAASAQAVVDQVVRAGIEGVLNFAPVTLNLPPVVSQVGVDLAIELERLSFAVMKSVGESQKEAEPENRELEK
ncbi:MAG TPA: redox-sensing transcriptional repressor Rex [Pirellulales bacterium]|jgi:redox-sensing transcriptional repressor|nr:redox-sensing transcriptional repressor Rex [Pirellulales bacterium]